MNADNAHPALLVDPAQRIFKVARRNFVDREIYEAEKENIFDRSWLYLGHSSELPKPGDFISRFEVDLCGLRDAAIDDIAVTRDLHKHLPAAR